MTLCVAVNYVLLYVAIWPIKMSVIILSVVMLSDVIQSLSVMVQCIARKNKEASFTKLSSWLFFHASGATTLSLMTPA
jgi:hypothetical protein